MENDDAPTEQTPIPVGTPLFRISQDDLETLERLMPELMWESMFGPWSTSKRVRWEKVKRILSDVRWGGGPPLQIERVD